MNIKTDNIDDIKALMANVLDGHNGENLYSYLSKFNQLNVGYVASAKSARETVPEIFRKTGLYLTYYIDSKPTTEIFIGDKTAAGTEESWIDDSNWEFSDGIGQVDSNNITLNQLSKEVLDLIGKSKKTSIINYPDGEDLTQVDVCGSDAKRAVHVLKFADKEYNPANFSGKGRVYLRKNIVDGKNILTQVMINKPNTRYIIQYDFDLNEQEITIPKGCILDFQGGSLNNGVINFNNTYIEGTKIIDCTITGNYFYKENADEEDITSIIENNTHVLKFKDRAYSPSTFSGKGYKILRKNIVDGKNIITSSNLYKVDTVFEIKYDFDLNGEKILLPAGTTLYFNGGSLNNGIILGYSSYIIGNIGKSTAKFNISRCYIHALDYYDSTTFTKSGNIDIKNIVEKIKESIGDMFYGNITVDFAGISNAVINETVEIPSYMNIDGGNCMITVKTFEDNSTPAIILYTEPGSKNMNSFFKNFIFWCDTNARDRLNILIKRTYVSIENLSFSNKQTKLIWQENAYRDGIKIKQIRVTNRDISTNPNLNILLCRGEGHEISDIGDGATIIKIGGMINIKNVINPSLILIFCQAFITNGIRETGSTYIYKSLVQLNQIGISDNLGNLSSSCIIDKENILDFIPTDYLANATKNAGYPTTVTFNNCALPIRGTILPSKVVNTTFDTNGTPNIIFNNNAYVKNVLYSERPKNYCNTIPNILDVTYYKTTYVKDKINISLEKSTEQYSNNDYYLNFRPDLNNIKPQISYNYDSIIPYIIYDENRKIGYKSSDIEFTLTNTFGYIHITNSENINYCNLYFYFKNSNEIVKRANILVHKNSGEVILILNPQFISDEPILDYTNEDKINECTKCIFNKNNIIAYLSEIPQYGEWQIGDKVVINNDLNNIYTYNGVNWTDKKGNIYGINYSGTTEQRPTSTDIGFQYFDTDLNKPIYWTGNKWVDAIGANV